ECYLPEQIKTIEQGLFAETNLVRVDIPAHIILIKKEAFYNCNQLTSLTLHEGLIEISDNAFKGCVGLRKVIIPKSVKKIGKNAFSRIEFGNLDITMHCYPGSCGLQYARANRFAYKDVTKKK
ncbi:MAG: leucine-rich repeat domain-containing protein, partial [Peptococcaceae bacterium]|nr:leucine-rich repeat domain-containing protein [Peptococcaceae bacterium]